MTSERFIKPQPKWKRLHRTDYWMQDNLVQVDYRFLSRTRSMILVHKLSANGLIRFSYNGKRYKFSISRHKGVK
jgi:hypothetical protein